MSRLAENLRRVEDALAIAEKAVAVGALLSMLALSAGQVFARNLLGAGWSEADVAVRHLVLLLAFAGGGLACGSGRHLHIELISRFLPLRFKVPSLVATQAGAAAVCALLAQAGWGMMASEKAGGSMLLASVPSWWATAIFPAGFAWLSLRFGLFALSAAVERRAPPDASAETGPPA